MSQPSTRTGESRKSVFATLLAPVVLVAVIGVVGWLLLVTVKWLIVTLLVAIGIALLVVPFAMGRRIIGTSVGAERRHRLVQLVTAVLLGVALIVLAVVVAHHGWLLIVVPAAIVLFGRIAGRISAARENRRARMFH